MKNVGVFFGSGSVEHDISIITAQLIITGLKGLGYLVTPIYITKQGRWMLGEDLGNLKLFTDPGKKVEEQESYQEYFLDMQESVGKIVFKKKGLLGKAITVNLAFPALHGTFGEDGTIQGLFEMFGVPYVGCNVTASAISMDKALTKIMMRDAGILTTKFVYFYKQDWQRDPSAIKNSVITQLKWPVMVKPAHLGSSIGIGKAKDEKELEQKVEVAAFYDNKIVIEEVVADLMDITCCIIGNEKPKASLLQESVYSQEIFDFNDKYLKGGGAQTGKAANNLFIPARLDIAVAKQIQDMAMKVYKLLECSGIARVDFLVNAKTKQFFVNEVNPLPGTLYHHLWKASGLELPELLKELIRLAEEKYQEKRSLNFTFESSVLKNSGKGKLGSAKLKT